MSFLTFIGIAVLITYAVVLLTIGLSFLIYFHLELLKEFGQQQLKDLFGDDEDFDTDMKQVPDLFDTRTEN